MKYVHCLRVILFAVLTTLLFPMGGWAQNAETYIHPRASQLLPVIKLEAQRFAPTIETPWYFAGLIEHESCISLRHSKCWSSRAELKNNREHGVGLAQLTRAWGKSGNLRFDNLEGLKRQYPNDLSELSWDTVKSRPDLQIRSMVIMINDTYRKLQPVKDPLERLKMSDSAYNGGLSHVNKARSLCGLTQGCNPQVWRLNVEKHLPKSNVPDARYGGQSMLSINLKHIYDVFEVRMPKFKPYF